jgi:hypothetical protein
MITSQYTTRYFNITVRFLHMSVLLKKTVGFSNHMSRNHTVFKNFKTKDMESPLSPELSDMLTQWSRHTEVGIKMLDVIALRILADFSSRELFYKAKPFFIGALLNGLSDEEIAVYSEAIPRKQNLRNDVNKEKKKKKKLICDRLEMKWHRILLKCFPPVEVLYFIVFIDLLIVYYRM